MKALELAAYILKNLAVVGVVAFAVWHTASAWSLLGLVFLSTWKSDPDVNADPEPPKEEG